MFIASLFIIAQIGNNSKVPQWRMYKQTVVHVYNRIALSKEKEWTIDTHNQLDCESIKLSERSQSQKVTYCMIPFSRHSWKDKTIVMEIRSVVTSGFKVMGRSHYKETACGNLGGWWNCSLFWLLWWLHESIHALRVIELYIKRGKS